jgi:hypothetical protein
MTAEDLGVLSDLAPEVGALGRVGVLSRDRTNELFPAATHLSRRRWDLNDPSDRRFDVLVAVNVFMHSPNPARWFRNVLASCRWFVLLAPVRRRRSETSEYGPDADRVRYAIGSERTRTDESFDLTSLGDRLLAWKTFRGSPTEYDKEPVQVVALLRGDLGQPVLRIDDYPTGVRPILEDLSPLHDLLVRIDAAGLPFHLGIVPTLLRDDMVGVLRGLRNMIPVVHGYDHCYPRYSRILIEAGDPFNERTVGVFNEFRGVPYGDVVARLIEARARLEEAFGRPVRWYIPPCNKGDRATGRGLVEAGYYGYLSEKRIPGCPLPWIRSDFYGRSRDYDASRAPDVTTLHLTWEADLEREGSDQMLGPLLQDLARRGEQLRDRVGPLRQLVGDGVRGGAV